MRHSSWTLLLVPLALALMAFLFPGSTKSSNRADPTAATYENLLEEGRSGFDARALSSGSAEATSERTSEAFYKD